MRFIVYFNSIRFSFFFERGEYQSYIYVWGKFSIADIALYLILNELRELKKDVITRLDKIESEQKKIHELISSLYRVDMEAQSVEALTKIHPSNI